MSPRLFPLGSTLVCLLVLSGTSSRGADDGPPQVMDQLVVVGRSTSLVGEASAPSQGEIGTQELSDRPFLRQGELLEAIPGIIVTQHSGDGKANQYFLRGFNLDHGTDFATTVDGMPVNLPSNAHGQGYSDLNFLIPEFVQSIAYEKGVYDAANADFSAAGAARFHLTDSIPQAFAKVEGGAFDYFRAVAGVTIDSPGRGPATTIGGEVGYNDGPWTHPEEASHLSGYGRHTWSQGENTFSLTALGYHADWDSTDQVPVRAVSEGLISRYGAIDPSDGGSTTRFSLSFDWNRQQGNGKWEVSAYALSYRLALYSDFTYFLNDPIHGDQFSQRDRRGVFGASVVREISGSLAGRSLITTFGWQAHSDAIALGLLQTEDRRVLAPVSQDSVHEDSGALYVQSAWKAADWLRIQGGIRGDEAWFDVSDSRSENSGQRSAGLLEPKLSLVLGPWDKTELYVDAGEGFHSNDARGTVEHVDPRDGSPASPVTPLVRATGAEVGMRTAVAPGLVSTVSLWALDLNSELTFDGDTGETDASGPTRRYGLEFANFYRPVPWLSLDGDLSFTHARYRAATNGGFRLPNSIGTVVAGGAKLTLPAGWLAALRIRRFGPQPLREDGSAWEPSSITWNARLGWRRAAWEVSFDVLNLFNRANDDIAYDYVSRLPGEPAAGLDGLQVHPAEPRECRVSLTHKF